MPKWRLTLCGDCSGTVEAGDSVSFEGAAVTLPAHCCPVQGGLHVARASVLQEKPEVCILYELSQLFRLLQTCKIKDGPNKPSGAGRQL